MISSLKGRALTISLWLSDPRDKTTPLSSLDSTERLNRTEAHIHKASGCKQIKYNAFQSYLQCSMTLTAQWVAPLPAHQAPRIEASGVSAHLFLHE